MRKFHPLMLLILAIIPFLLFLLNGEAYLDKSFNVEEISFDDLQYFDIQSSGLLFEEVRKILLKSHFHRFVEIHRNSEKHDFDKSSGHFIGKFEFRLKNGQVWTFQTFQDRRDGSYYYHDGYYRYRNQDILVFFEEIFTNNTDF